MRVHIRTHTRNRSCKYFVYACKRVNKLELVASYSKHSPLFPGLAKSTFTAAALPPSPCVASWHLLHRSLKSLQWGQTDRSWALLDEAARHCRQQ